MPKDKVKWWWLAIPQKARRWQLSSLSIFGGSYPLPRTLGCFLSPIFKFAFLCLHPKCWSPEAGLLPPPQEHLAPFLSPCQPGVGPPVMQVGYFADGLPLCLTPCIYSSWSAAHPIKSLGEIKIKVAFQQPKRLIMVRSPDCAMYFGWSFKYLILSLNFSSIVDRLSRSCPL